MKTFKRKNGNTHTDGPMWREATDYFRIWHEAAEAYQWVRRTPKVRGKALRKAMKRLRHRVAGRAV